MKEERQEAAAEEEVAAAAAEEEEEEEGRRRRRGREAEQPKNCCRLPTRRVREEPRGDAPERWPERERET